MPRVFIPPLLRPLADGADIVTVSGKTVGEAIAQLERRFPGMRERLCDGGSLKPDLAVAVDGNLSSRGLLETVAAESEVHFLPAIGGG